jgi:hypothetical protein
MSSKTNKPAPNTSLQQILEQLHVHCVTPAVFERCKTAQGTKLPFDALIVVDGVVGLICVDTPSRFQEAYHDSIEAFHGQRERDQTRNRYARDAKLSLLRVATHEAGVDLRALVTSFISTLSQGPKTPLVVLSNPSLYANMYGDGSSPQLAITERPGEYPPPATADKVEKVLEKPVDKAEKVPEKVAVSSSWKIWPFGSTPAIPGQPPQAPPTVAAPASASPVATPTLVPTPAPTTPAAPAAAPIATPVAAPLPVQAAVPAIVTVVPAPKPKAA